MPETVTTIGGMFVLGCLLWLTALAGYFRGYFRGRHDERERHEAEQAKRLSRIMRSIRCAPSPVTLTLGGFPDDASAATYLCRMFSGTDRIVEEVE